MTLPPPALATPPQFTAQHWANVKREMTKVKIERITDLTQEGNLLEFVFDNGEAFQRRADGLNPDVMAKVHANVQVFVETIQGVLVTGLFVPETGWLFRMTNEQIAEYAKKLAVADHNQRQQAREQLRGFMAMAIRDAILEHHGEDIEGVDWEAVASTVMGAMAQAQPASAPNAR